MAIYIQNYVCQVVPFLGKIPGTMLERKKTETTNEFRHFFADTVATIKYYKIASPQRRCRKLEALLWHTHGGEVLDPPAGPKIHLKM